MQLLSIVIPVYNSAPMLEELFTRIHKTLDGKQAFEVIFVDDGSRDGSWNELEKLKAKFPSNITAIRLKRNYGQHNAIVCGFNHMKGDAVVTMDDDLQHPPEEIPKLLEKFAETSADVVYGIPRDRKQTPVRKVGSYVVRRSSKYWVGALGEGSSFRLIKKNIVERILGHQHHTFLFIDEIIHWHTGHIATTDVDHHARKTGKSGYNVFKLFTMYTNILINHTAIPLKMMTWIGLASSFISFVLGAYFIYRKLRFDVPIGFTAQIVTILFSTSILMLCMGVVGQYLYKLFLLQNKRPPYSIHKLI